MQETPVRGRRPDVIQLHTTGKASGRSRANPQISRRLSLSISAPEQPQTYASLPPSPISPSPPPSFRHSKKDDVNLPPFSIWDYLREELLATDFDSHQELKWERVSNFLQIPLAVEKIISFGFILCFDSLLYSFTVLPIRFFLALFRLFVNTVFHTGDYLPPSQKADLLRTVLIILSISILVPLTDASKIYHSIRGQDTIKLYVIFNALEIADRLCTSFGQDIVDCLFSRSTLLPLSRKHPFGSHIFRPLLFLLLATAYTVCHTLVLIYQLTSLNVAINSYDQSLLTLLVSNQFVEIKSSVFKKFEKDNLFQITCADIVERFQLSLMLIAVAFRNLIELSGSEFELTDSLVLPQSFGWSRHGSIVWRIFSPVMTVLMSEYLVDWLKHAFITKFNHIRPSVYERYTDVLCRDLTSGSAVGRRGARKHSYVDQSPLVARRLGFAALPMAVLCVIIGAQCLTLIHGTHSSKYGSQTMVHISRNIKWIALGVLFWLCFVVVKVMLGVHLVSYAFHRRAGMDAREAEDAINDFGRDPIGEGKEEQIYNQELKAMLDRRQDDASHVSEMGENEKTRHVKQEGKGGRLKLEELTRFTMVKRIW
ncbi:eukaryotic membrane protein family-domain-containing protein [Hysterangium stoloniferum]|nr:eukaryotic membrane protein family-domain-containing protein [Hysterangium stoloniferum]